MDRSAIPPNFGLDFQANAAIVLMLENMKELDSIRLECNEDIDIALSDGTYVLAQAKSVVKSSTDFRNVRANAKKAFNSLSDAASKVKAKELIFITNSPNPFNDDVSKNMFYGASYVKYDELPSTTKDLINVYLSQMRLPLDTTKLKIQILPFEGDNEKQRYKVILEAISDFLDDLQLSEYGCRKTLHGVWNVMLNRSGTKSDKEIKLWKKDLVWPIIVCVTGHGILDRNAQYCTGLDDGEFEEINMKYKEIIDYCSERYELVTKVIYNFSLSGLSNKDAISSFINDHWKDYIDELDLTDLEDETIQSSLMKIIMYTILAKRYTINRIKKAVNL